MCRLISPKIIKYEDNYKFEKGFNFFSFSSGNCGFYLNLATGLKLKVKISIALILYYFYENGQRLKD